MMKILVTGGAGFIGSNMARYQLSKGNDVWIVDNLITGRMSNLDDILPKIQFDEADLANWPKISQAVAWADEIYHFAGSVGQLFILKNPVYTITNNIHGCENILKAMTQVQSKARLIIASTSELYCYSEEDPDGTTSEDAMMSMPPNQFLQNTYPIGKLVNEVMAFSYAYEKGLHCTVARIFNTIGMNQSGSYGMVVPTFIKQATQNKPITVYGDGKQTRSFSDVRDTITALDMLIKVDASNGQIVNVGNDKECSINELAQLIKTKAKSTSEIEYMSYEQAYGVPFTDVRRRQPNLKKLKELTGFEHRYTLEDTIDHILQATK